jgi:two-component system capsular synthesis sensor histidine kinase RcsC
MNGHAATQAIRDMGYTGVILGVTANALAEDQVEFARAGVNAIITKPVNVALLLEAVQRYLRQPGSPPSEENVGMLS